MTTLGGDAVDAGMGAGLSTRRLAAPSLAQVTAWLAAQARAQSGRASLWAAVCFAFGCVAYLDWPVEPPLWLLAGLTAAFALGALAARRWAPRRWPAIALALPGFLVGGMLAGEIRAERVAAPVMPAETTTRVQGWVVEVVSPGASGPRLLIAPVRIAGLDPERTPKRIRLTVPRDAVAGPGSPISVLALLGPPPAPASPGAYDFARDAWFQSVGGVGVALTRPALADLPPAPWRLRATMDLNATRWSLSRRLVARMGETDGGLGAAMVTGHEAWVTQQQQDDMRASGLAHIISISGVHMAIVGGFVFAAVRLLIAAWPWLALRVSGKKVAAGAGLAAILVYLLVSGAPPAAVRSAVTAAAAFGAVLADRRVFSLHTLALAALGILILQPEDAGLAGFRMSFAATAALIALAELWPRRPAPIETPWWIRLIQRARDAVVISLAISFVAGLATGPFAMQDFNRVAIWGAPANLLLEPLEGLVIMPFLALGAALEPLGAGGPFLAVAAWGIAAMRWLARTFAHAPLATITVASAPPIALAVAVVGLMIVCLWKGPLRWIGLPLALAVSFWPRPGPPDAWISADGATAAVREGKTAVLLRADTRRYATDLWARRRGLDERDGAAVYPCARYACRPMAAAPVKLSLSWTRKAPEGERLADQCDGAEIVVIRGIPASLPATCAGKLMLMGADFAKGGAAELYRKPDGWRVVWAQPLRGVRPWTALSDSDE